MLCNFLSRLQLLDSRWRTECIDVYEKPSKQTHDDALLVALVFDSYSSSSPNHYTM